MAGVYELHAIIGDEVQAFNSTDAVNVRIGEGVDVIETRNVALTTAEVELPNVGLGRE